MIDQDDELILEERDGIARLILNRPQKRNAIGYAMWRGLGDAFEALADDPDVRVVILRGAGDAAFSAGADISEFKTLRSTPDSRTAYDQTMRRAFDRLANLPKFTIAMIDGVCVGGGAEVAMECDVMIASDRARLGITPTRLGLGSINCPTWSGWSAASAPTGQRKFWRRGSCSMPLTLWPWVGSTWSYRRRI
jgi:enoyl-CoA hydratase/carnithine racemase